MNCTHCLTELVNPESTFCHKCGKPVLAECGNDVQPTPPVKAFKLTWVFWLLIFLVFSSWLGYFLTLFPGHEVTGKVALPAVVWTGGLFAYIWKKKRNQGWQGFILGAIVAFAVFTVVGFAQTYLRADALLNQAEHRAVPETQAPK